MSYNGIFAHGNDLQAAELNEVLKSLWNHISGLELSNNSVDADHDLDVAPGACMDSTRTYLMRLPTTMIKQLDIPWAVGSTLGGMLDGVAPVANTWYNVFLFRRDTDGVVDVGFTVLLDPTADLPSGYTAWRLIGSMKTDGTTPGNWLGFSNIGADFRWKSPILDINVITAPGVTPASLHVLRVPIGREIWSLTNYYNVKSATFVRMYISDSNVDDEPPSLTDNTPPLSTTISPVSGGPFILGKFSCLTNTSSEIRVRFSATSVTFRGSCLGWIDPERQG